MADNKHRITTASGRPYTENENTLSAGSRGPLLLEDVILHEKMAHFNRERIPERVVHAKGTGAYGRFVVTNDVTAYTKAKVVAAVGKETPVFIRFSTVGGERGSADTERDPRGFAVKFYTDDGVWDIVGNNTPVFFVKDPKKFSDFIHTQKRDPRTNTKSPTMMWDFWSLNPESLHQVLILFSDRGTPYSYRHMDGFSSHTFSMINADGVRHWVKFHFKSTLGNRTFTREEAEAMRGMDADWAQRDLVQAIDRGDYPTWKVSIQVMTEDQATSFPWNPFDLTKVWPHADYPLIDVGVLELNRIPDNYFADVEQAAFAPSHIVPGIGFSPDKMLQGRLLSYPDAHRYRLGANYEQLPVNRCPFHVHNHQRDGAMRYDGNGGAAPNYWPNSMGQDVVDTSAAEPARDLGHVVADWYDRNGPGEDDHYSQPAALLRVMTPDARRRTIDNIVHAMAGIEGPYRDTIVERQLGHFRRVDADFGAAIADGLRKLG